MSKATAIVRLDSFPNRTHTGRSSATAARKLAMYLAHGRGRVQDQAERPIRGLWHDEKGNILRHQEVLSWVVEQGKQNEFTYQFILSTKYAALDEDEYTKALQAGGELLSSWRLMRHEDGGYPHAHVLAFGDKEIRIKDAAFQAWCQQVRTALEHMQTQQLDSVREQQLAQMLSEEQQHQRGWGLEL